MYYRVLEYKTSIGFIIKRTPFSLKHQGEFVKFNEDLWRLNHMLEQSPGLKNYVFHAEIC